MTPYAPLARYYDLENADFTEDLPFWFDMATQFGDPILELGCGTGRVLLALARPGYTITGIDNSAEMLTRLDAKYGQSASTQVQTGFGMRCRVSTVNADMRDFHLEETFKLAIMPFNTFMHLLTLEDQMAALTSIRRHLSPGGGLALDVANPADVYAAPEQGLVLERTFKDGECVVQQFSSMQLDRAAQLARITWLYDSAPPGGSVQRTTVPMTLRYTFPAEMRLLLERCGFTLRNLYGDYERAPFGDGASRMLVVAAAG
jgi:SAM-dependent methyltransferase